MTHHLISDTVQPLLHYLQNHPHWGFIITFIIAFSESLPVIGTIIPGSITMTAIGTLVGIGVLPSTTTLLWAIFGAFSGDSVSFWAGRYFQDGLLKIWPFRKYPHWIEKSEAFFASHGGKSVIIGRFIGPARSTVPMVAGLLKMPWLRFMLAALPSAMLWALAYMLPGIILGSLSLEFPPKEMTTVIVVGLLIIVGLWVLFWLVQRFCLYLLEHIDQLFKQLWQTLAYSCRGQIFSQWLAQPQDPKAHQQLTRLLSSILSALLFCAIFYSLSQHGVITLLNQPLYYLTQSLRYTGLDHFFIVITQLGNPKGLLISSSLITLGLLVMRQGRTALSLFLLILLSFGSVWLFKTLYYSPRPDIFFQAATSSSFPSGHTTLSVAVYFFLAWLTAERINTTYRWLPYLAATLVAILVSCSRLYLGAHWLSDIIASWCLGTAIVLLCIMLRKRATPINPTPQLRYWLTAVSLMILLPYSTMLYSQFQYNIQKYQWQDIQRSATIKQWWQKPTTVTPFYRLNRFGQPSQPFNIQWAGSLNSIKHFLHQQQWKILKNGDSHFKNTVRRFSSYKPEFHLPLLPWLYHGKKAQLIMVKHIQNSPDIIELRLWQAHVDFTDSPLPLWIGILSYHKAPEKLLYIHNQHLLKLRSGKKFNIMFTQPNGFITKLIHINDTQTDPQQRKLDWDGNILLIKKSKGYHQHILSIP